MGCTESTVAGVSAAHPGAVMSACAKRPGCAALTPGYAGFLSLKECDFWFNDRTPAQRLARLRRWLDRQTLIQRLPYFLAHAPYLGQARRSETGITP